MDSSRNSTPGQKAPIYKRKQIPFLKERVNDHMFIQNLDLENLRVQEAVEIATKRAEMANESHLKESSRKVHKLVASRILIHAKDDQNRIEKWKLLRGECTTRKELVSSAVHDQEFHLMKSFLDSQRQVWRARISKEKLQQLKSRVACCLYKHASQSTALSVRVGLDHLAYPFPRTRETTRARKGRNRAPASCQVWTTAPGKRCYCSQT